MSATYIQPAARPQAARGPKRQACGPAGKVSLGLVIEDYRGLPTVSHGGSVPGYNTFMLRFPEQKFATTILCNVGGGPARVAAKAIADIYLEGQGLKFERASRRAR